MLYHICDCIRLQLMQSSQLFVACIQCWHARCMCVLLFSYNIIQLWCIQCDTIFTIRSHIRRLGWPQLRTPWHVEAGLLYSEHYYAKLWHSEASLNHTQDSEAYLGILCQLLAQFHKFTNCQCHPMAFTFQPYDSIQASRNKSQIVQTIVYKFLPCILVSLSTYSVVRLVRPNTEELISRPFFGLLKICWLLQDRRRT